MYSYINHYYYNHYYYQFVYFLPFLGGGGGGARVNGNCTLVLLIRHSSNGFDQRCHFVLEPSIYVIVLLHYLHLLARGIFSNKM